MREMKLITWTFEDEITIYPISDVHLGSLEHNAAEWRKFCEKINSEPNSYVILGGDLINNATRSSVSNIFEEVLRPQEQKERMVAFLTPIKHKILCAVGGNHERRSIKDADCDPMRDIMVKMDLEDIYRENMAFMKVQILNAKSPSGKKDKIFTYTFAVTHGAGGGVLTGSSVNKNERFGLAIDGLDCLVVGHTHKGTVTKPAKIVIDPRNDVVTVKPFTVITSQAWMNYGGYAMQKMMLPSSCATAEDGQKLVLEKKKKNIKVVW